PGFVDVTAPYDPEGAKRRAERFRQKVARTRFDPDLDANRKWRRRMQSMTVLDDHGRPSPLVVRNWVPCGKCSVCLRRRQRKWTARSYSEWELSDERVEIIDGEEVRCRTWMVTLTISDEGLYLVDAGCVAICRDEGKDFETLPEQLRLALRFRVLS